MISSVMKRSQLEELETGFRRRRFLHWCAVCAGVVALPPHWIRLLSVAQHKSSGSNKLPASGSGLAFHFFSRMQAATVEALTDQIIPADQDPGAKWAGVVHYVDLALDGDLRDFRLIYTEGINRVEAIADTLAGKMFADLQFADQTKVLERLEQDHTVIVGKLAGADFFQLVRKHTLEGFFGDPKYGGNRDSVGWRILNFEA